MDFDKRKFNIIVAFTVCLMCFVVAFSAVGLSLDVDNFSDTSADSGLESPIIDDENEEEADNTVITKAPIFTINEKWQCLNYAMNNLTKKNYKLFLKQNVANSFANQTIEKTVYHISNKSYTKTVTSGFENFTEYGYVEKETKVVTKRDSLIKEYKYSDFLLKNGLSSDGFSYTLNQSTCTIDKFAVDPFKMDYYTLTITLNEKGYANYLKAMKNNSGKDVSMKSITFIMKIKIKDCTITSVSAVEKYDIAIGITVHCTSNVTMVFTYKTYADSEKMLSDIKKQFSL